MIKDRIKQYEIQLRILGSVSGCIEWDTYNWAVNMIQEPAIDKDTYWSDPQSQLVITTMAHARWIIEKVKDGTLWIPPIEFEKEK